MKVHRIILIFLAVTFLWPGITWAVEFKADMIMITTAGEEQFMGHVAIARPGDKMKMRMEMTQNGQQMISIMRGDRNVVWMVMPSERMYMETRLDRSKHRLPEVNKKANMKLLGKETFDGHPCAVYEVREGGEIMKVWLAKDLEDFPIKTETKDGSIVYKNIKKGKLPQSLFEVPAGYQKMVMPGFGGMEGMPGMGGMH